MENEEDSLVNYVVQFVPRERSFQQYIGELPGAVSIFAVQEKVICEVYLTIKLIQITYSIKAEHIYTFCMVSQYKFKALESIWHCSNRTLCWLLEKI